MILVASSVNEATVTEINSQAAEFLNATSTLNASIILNSVLEAARIDCTVSNALVTSLHHGSFLWMNSVTPSGLASSVITSEDMVRTDTLYEGLVLDLSTKFEMQPAALEKLTKTQVKFPADVEGLIATLNEAGDGGDWVETSGLIEVCNTAKPIATPPWKVVAFLMGRRVLF